MSDTHNHPNEEISHVEPDDIGVGMLIVLAGLVAVSIVLIVVLLQAWFYNWKDALVAQRDAAPDQQSAAVALAGEQLQRIESYGWVDAKKKFRGIPIARAMELIVEENAGDSGAQPPPKEASGQEANKKVKDRGDKANDAKASGEKVNEVKK